MRAVVLKRFPDGIPCSDDFAVVAAPAATGGDGVRVRVRFLSLDPYLRSVMSGRHVGHSMAPGDIVPGGGVGEVVESTSLDFAPGDWVQGEFGWREDAIIPVGQVRKLPSGVAPSTALGVLGMPGLTAYAGVNDILQPGAGQTIVVSAPLGPVGSTVGQLAKRAGARVVGIAGGARKCELALSVLGFDDCIDYRSEDFVAALHRACPNRIDAYFDNVGGRVLEAALGHLNLHARVALCGLIDQYNKAERPPGPNLGPVIAARATLTGLVVYDHFHRLPAMLDELVPLVKAGELKYLEDIAQGIESTPAAFARLMRGENIGKALVAL